MMLQSQIRSYPVPSCVAIVLEAGDLDDRGLDKILSLIEWSTPLGIETLLLHISEDCQQLSSRISSRLSEANADISIHTINGVLRTGRGGQSLVISLGFGGKQEVTAAIKSIMHDVFDGRLSPEDIDESRIEERLRFEQRPELVIRAGGKRLSDFMIWQAAYSELYFTELNWASMRMIDFLRAIRDYQRRERRFGR
jgi:undecaprenyl diphosphate synthase